MYSLSLPTPLRSWKETKRRKWNTVSLPFLLGFHFKATAAEEACCFRFANTFLYYSWYTCVPSCILVDLLRCVRLVCVHRTVIERLPPGDIGTSVKPRLLLRKGFFETKTRSSQRRPRPPASSSVFLVAAEASSAPTSGSARASFFCGSVATATGLGKIHSVVVAVAHKASQLLLPMFHAISGFLLSSQQSNNLVRKDWIILRSFLSD